MIFTKLIPKEFIKHREEHHEIYSPLQKILDATKPKHINSFDEKHDIICSRCTALNIHELFTTNQLRTQADLRSYGDRREYSDPLIINLGELSKLNYDSKCGFCKFIRFLVRLNPVLQEDRPLLLVPALSIHRFEPELSLIKYKESCKYSNYAFLAQSIEDDHGQTRLAYCHESPEAFGLVKETGNFEAMRVLPVKPRVANYDLLQTWMTLCTENHGDACKVYTSSTLNIIRLIDVKTRKVVRYRDNMGCEYLALSYVWGNAVVPKDYSLLENLPQTIEDAIQITVQLGKRFIWIDLICIEQANTYDKQKHIDIMSDIYRGAWATVIALDSKDAQSGISRSTPEPRPHVLPFVRQHQIKINNLHLATTLPTLKQATTRSHWSSRSWTFQEAILSPRCLYFTASQVYFECNSAQSAESIHISYSSFHTYPPAGRKAMTGSCVCHGGGQAALGTGVLRDPLSATTLESAALRRKHRVQRYCLLLEEYSARHMTYAEDALAAFSAILQQLAQASFPAGCFWGLPVEILPIALLFEHEQEPVRRQGFPSWSWAGWSGRLKQACAYGSLLNDSFGPHMRAWKVVNGQPEKVFQSQIVRWSGIRKGYDPIVDAQLPSIDEVKLLAKGLPTSCHDQMLILEGIVWTMNFLPELNTEIRDNIWGLYRVETHLNDTLCIFTCDDKKSFSILQSGNFDLFFIGRHCDGIAGWVYEFFLLGWIGGNKATFRATKIGRVKMFLGNVANHNEVCNKIFTMDNMSVVPIALE